MKNDGPTKKLARFAAELKYEDIPKSTIENIKLCLLDTLGCGIFGSSLRWSRIVADFAKELGGPRESTIWGRNFKVSAANAALANGTAVHSFEIDDLHKTSIVHPGSVVVSTAISMAEHLGGCSGKEFIASIVAGYEIAIRVGMSVGTSHLQKGFHPTGTNGTFGAAAAAGKLINLDAERMTHALGIAGTQAAGLMAAQYAAMVKRMHAGRAAQSGVYGALLAKKGFTGITNILEADYGGYLKVMANRSNSHLLTVGLGEKFETGLVGFKPYAAGGSTHTGHEAVKAIVEKNKLDAEMIESIVIRATTATYQHTSWEYKPEGVTAAQMNMQYVVAVTVLEGDLFIEQFAEEKFKDPKIIEFTKKVKVMPDPELDKLGPEFRHTVIAEVRAKSGEVFTKKIESAKGSNKNPMSYDEVVQKYKKLASKVINEDKINNIYDMVIDIENIPNVTELGLELLSN